jgi:hypothetical protein
MNKPVRVLLQFDKTRFECGFWLAIVDIADKKDVREINNEVVAALGVKSYSLEDHQFIQLKLDVAKGHELQVSIPRNFVTGIIEGKSDLTAAFSFVGKTTK